MTAPFLALITPLSDARPDNTLPVPPYPVDPGYSPPWARPQPPYPDNTLPRPPGYPSHPIYYPPYPDQGLPPFPSQGLPGSQPRPDHGLPPFPSHPIYIPPEGSPPPLGIWGPPDMPPGFWGGGMGPGVKPQPHPEHPIVLPPDLPPETPEGGKITWKTAWTEKTGWIVVGIPSEGTLVPTPST